MNYQFLETYDKKQLKKFINQINDNLYRARKFSWQPGMVEVWKSGKKKAENILAELENKAA